MAYYHQLWEPPISPAKVSTAQKEIQLAQKLEARTERERQFINALSLVYQDAATVPYAARALRYEDAMSSLAAKNPQDVEAQVFYALALLADMLRVRRLEEKAAERYGAGRIRGFLHLYIGEEATGAGVLRALTPEDNVVATYREHAHALLRGMSMGVLMAEMYGKQEGCARGRGGSMHLFDRATRLFGGNAIVGGSLPLAVGVAWLHDACLRCEYCGLRIGDAGAFAVQ